MSDQLLESPEPNAQLLLGWNQSSHPSIGFTHLDNPLDLLDPVWSNEEGHLMTIAPTGQGKGRSCIIPSLLRWRHQAIVIDPKGETAAVTARQRAAFGDVIIIDPFKIVKADSDTLNPFDIQHFGTTSLADVAMMMVDILAGPMPNVREPYWEIMGRSLLGGVIALELERAQKAKEEAHLGKIREYLSHPDFIYQVMNALDNGIENTYAKEELGQFLSVNSDVTRGCILSTAQQYVKIMGEPTTQASLAHTSFSLEALREGKPLTIYLILPPTRLGSHAKLLRLWIASFMHILLSRRKRPKLPCLFILDEAAQLGELEQLRTAMTLMRGYGVKVWSFWQDVSQLKRLYPSDWETIVNNAAAIQAFGVPNQRFAAQIADLMGGISPEVLLDLPTNEQVIMQTGGKVQIAKKLDYLKDARYQGRYDPNPLIDGGDVGIG